MRGRGEAEYFHGQKQILSVPPPPWPCPCGYDTAISRTISCRRKNVVRETLLVSSLVCVGICPSCLVEPVVGPIGSNLIGHDSLTNFESTSLIGLCFAANLWLGYVRVPLFSSGKTGACGRCFTSCQILVLPNISTSLDTFCLHLIVYLPHLTSCVGYFPVLSLFPSCPVGYI